MKTIIANQNDTQRIKMMRRDLKTRSALNIGQFPRLSVSDKYAERMIFLSNFDPYSRFLIFSLLIFGLFHVYIR